MLKTGSDAFLETGQPPTVAVCDRRYVFSPPAMNSDLDPSGPCPDVDITSDVAAIRAPQSASAIPAHAGQSSEGSRDPFVQKIQEILREH
jgi:murein L,D-transpeptidase YafK